MICPHCKKAIPDLVSDEALKRAKQLLGEGHSYRSVEKLLFAEGLKASFATLSRHFPREKRKRR